MNNYKVISFYKYVSIEDPEKLANEHLQWCIDNGIKGKVYFAKEGINGAVFGVYDLIEDYKNAAPQKLYKSSRNGLLKDIPIVVLVNKGTASAAEILAGALHDNRNVLIVGEKTFGKGSVQELINLPGNNSLKITIAHWLTPKGIDISKKGIVPDIEIKIPESEISSAYAETSLEKDIQLKRAYDELLKIINK